MSVLKTKISAKKVQPYAAKRLNLQRGFSLIEMLVATSIITIVMLTAIGSVITIQDANRKAQAVRAVIDNLNGAMENISRKIRTGSTYHCGEPPNLPIITAFDCPNDPGYGTAFAFMSAEDFDVNGESQPLVYKLVGTTIQYYSPAFGSKYLPLIDPRVKIESLRFYVHTASTHPSVLITMKGSITLTKPPVSVPFNIQTTISQYLAN